MAQSLELNIKTTSDVPQAMDKAKAATSSFEKQVGDIGKKFGTSFKDIFLSFLGPMALVTAAIGVVAKMIAENQRNTEEAYRAAIDGTNELMSAQDRYYARKQDLKRKEAETKEEARTARIDVTESFLRTDPRGKEMVQKVYEAFRGSAFGVPLEKNVTPMAARQISSDLAKSEKVQIEVQKMIAEDMVKNPLPETKKEPEKPTSPKASETLGAGVIGVGASAQILLAQEANATLASMDAKLGLLVNEGIDKDPTKPLGRKYPLYSPGMSR